MENRINRRSFATRMSLAGIAAFIPEKGIQKKPVKNKPGSEYLRLSLNAFSFNDLLLARKITTDDVLDFCAKT